jgi:hypothetical protein
MAKNKEAGDNRRVGAVKSRSQIKNAITGTWTKRDDKSGKFLDVKDDKKPFKGVRKTKSAMKTKTVAAKSVAAKKTSAKKAPAKAPAKKAAAKKTVKRVAKKMPVKKAPAKKAAKKAAKKR